MFFLVSGLVVLGTFGERFIRHFILPASQNSTRMIGCDDAFFFALEVQRGPIPGAPNATEFSDLFIGGLLSPGAVRCNKCEQCLLRGTFRLSKLVLFVIGSPAQFRDRVRSLSNVNRSGSQNASKNAAAAAEKTE
jgi:hypothetical protein